MKIDRKIKVYLDTSVISYLDQQDSPEKMQETREVWERLKSGRYEIFISDVVIRELEDCKNDEKRNRLLNCLSEIDYNLVIVDDDTARLAEKFIENGVLKKKSIADCEHIAAAILSDCDVIISWNLKHIANIKTVRGIRIITMTENYKDILIYPPSVLLSEED